MGVTRQHTDQEYEGELRRLREQELNDEPPLKPYLDLPRMAETAQAMVRDALDAFVAGDAECAQQVIERDKNLDAYYADIFRVLLTYMMEDPRNIYRATRVQSIAKYLERIGDHATNLAEMVVFMVRGKDIRHSGSSRAISRPPSQVAVSGGASGGVSGGVSSGALPAAAPSEPGKGAG
jgi:phosphate transport system protein